jgi:hypothetical protein
MVNFIRLLRDGECLFGIEAELLLELSDVVLFEGYEALYIDRLIERPTRAVHIMTASFQGSEADRGFEVDHRRGGFVALRVGDGLFDGVVIPADDTCESSLFSCAATYSSPCSTCRTFQP